MGNHETTDGSSDFMVNHGGGIGYHICAYCERFCNVREKYFNNNSPAYHSNNSQYLFLSTRGKRIDYMFPSTS